jgi:peptide-methionine (R)-S-oxide reductase
MSDKIKRTEAQWRAQLDPEQFRVARQAGTERAFTGKYWNTKTAGTYNCVCCGEPLFTSGGKFDSGCGWPSFVAAAEGAPVEEHVDSSYGMRRVEVTCGKCDAHLGHVFPDGPRDRGGLRYCINSASIDLEEEG